MGLTKQSSSASSILGGGATLGSPSTAVLTIVDNDLNTLQLRANKESTTAESRPIFALDDTKPAFGFVTVNSWQSRLIEVHNLGGADLDVNQITRCLGTGTEFSWSPDFFRIPPGSSQTLTVFYSPVEPHFSERCLQVFTNDPTQNPVTLNLSGSGIVLSSAPLLDFDIVRFKISPNFSLRAPVPVAIEVQVANTASIDGTAEITVVGIQNKTEVYRETIPVPLAVGSAQPVQFSPYTPVALAEINWQVTIKDQDPDVDEAGTTTIVLP